MNSLQKKVLIYFVIIGLIPIGIFMSYYYDVSNNRVMEKFDGESQNILKLYDNNLVVRINRLQNSADILFDDENFYRTLRENDVEEGAETIQEMLDEIYEKFAKNEKGLRSLLMFSVNSNLYISGEQMEPHDAFSLVLKYDSVGEKAGVVSWMGLKENYNDEKNNQIVASIIIRDICAEKDHAYLATIYLIFEEDFFKVNEGEQVRFDGETYVRIQDREDCISVYDASNSFIYSTGNETLRDAYFLRTSYPRSTDYRQDADGFNVVIDNEEYRVIYYTSPITGWKLVRAISYENYMRELKNVRYLTIILLLLLLAIWYTFNYFVIKKLTLSLRELHSAMKTIENDNFEIELKKRSDDEIGTLVLRFNSMVKHIKTLRKRIQMEEEKRRNLDVLMLRYQMNPHFLYNTIAAIRFKAILNRQSEIGDMLFLLGRFLRNAITSVDSTVDVKNEIDSINDYISLYQIRYNNRIELEIHVEESCYNYQILSMLCQPIIENSLIHGLNYNLKNNKRAILKISVAEDAENLHISVWDNGKGIKADVLKELFKTNKLNDVGKHDRLHIGLQNIHKRIELTYGVPYGVFVESIPEEYTEVIIKLPKILKNQEKKDFLISQAEETDEE